MFSITIFRCLFIITTSFIVPFTGEKHLGLPRIDHPSLNWSIENNIIVVDKTKFLIRMLETRFTIFFLSRPRRFGKSFLIDVMYEFFRGEQQLFKDTFVFNEYPGHTWEEYPVIRIDFSDGISFDSVEAYESDLRAILKGIAKSYNISIDDNISSKGMLRELIMTLKKNTGLKVVILLDEYDVPYAKSYNEPHAPRILKALQSLFMTIKSQTGQDNVHFLFFTGASTVAISEFMTSTTALDLSLLPEYDAIVGFTEEELDKYFESAIQNVANKQNKRYNDIRKEMKMWHDGFKFSGVGERVYNPCSVVSYLWSNGKKKNFWSLSGGFSTLLRDKFLQSPFLAYDYVLKYATDFTSCSGNETSSDKLEPLSVKESVLSGNVDSAKTSIAALQAVLFHGGYLTIEREICGTFESDYVLRFGNLEVQYDYIERLSRTLLENANAEHQDRIRDLKVTLDANQWESFISRLNSLFAQTPYFMYPCEEKTTKSQRKKKQKTTKTKKITESEITKPSETTDIKEIAETTNSEVTETKNPKNSEAMYQFQMYVFMIQANYRIDLEVMTSSGRADLVIQAESTTFIFEIKLKENRANPLDQCLKKYVPKFIHSQRKVICIGLKFSQGAEVVAWGVAHFSQDGRLLKEDGEIKLTTTQRELLP